MWLWPFVLAATLSFLNLLCSSSNCVCGGVACSCCCCCCWNVAVVVNVGNTEVTVAAFPFVVTSLLLLLLLLLLVALLHKNVMLLILANEQCQQQKSNVFVCVENLNSEMGQSLAHTRTHARTVGQKETEITHSHTQQIYAQCGRRTKTRCDLIVIIALLNLISFDIEIYASVYVCLYVCICR